MITKSYQQTIKTNRWSHSTKTVLWHHTLMLMLSFEMTLV